jgi:anti-sigma-K factor RskA
VVWHDEPSESAAERRAAAAVSGRAVGWLLARHRFATPILARMAVRPLGSAVVSLARLDVETARVRLATLAGRITGYLEGRSARR